MGRHGVEQVNTNGLRLLTLCAEHNLTITNTLFQQKAKYKTSWMHPRSKHWHLIDYIIARHADISSVLLTRAMRGAECWTEHRLIIAKLHIKVRPTHRLRKTIKKQLNCAKLKSTQARDMFRHSVGTKVEECETILCSDNTIDQKWTSIASMLHNAAVDTIGYKTRKHQDWFDDNSDTILAMLETMHRAYIDTINCPASTILWQKWKAIRREVQKTLRCLQNEWWLNKAREIQSIRNDMHNFTAP